MNLRPTLVAIACISVVPSVLHAQQSFPRRTPGAPFWSDYPNAVKGNFATAQEVCNARAALLNSSHLEYKAVTTYRGNCVDSRGNALGSPFRGQVCPRHYSMYDWVERWGWYVEDGVEYGIYYGPQQYCKSSWPYVDRWHDKAGGQCQPSGGNPIFPLTGTKRQSENLLSWSPGLPALTVTFDNRRRLPNTDPDGVFILQAAPSFGGLWESSVHRRLVIQAGNSPTSYYRHIQASRGSGAWVGFIRRTSTGETQTPDSDISDRIAATSSGFRYIDAAAMSQEDYTSSGVLTAVSYAHGATLTYTYSDASTAPAVAPIAGLLIKLQDRFGRALNFEYEASSGVSVPRIARIIGPDGQTLQARYDAAGNLSQITWPDGKVRQFLYEQSGLPWALTGIINENSERHSTYTYDAEGRAQSTEYAGGVNRYSLSYSDPPRWVTTETFDATQVVFWRDHSWQAPQHATMTTPNGSVVALGTQVVNGMPRVTTRTQPAGAGCDASTSSLAYDANGNIVSKTGFNGTKSCHAYDLSRNLETARLEGLSDNETCPTDIGAYAIPAESTQRKTTTQWHPDWSLPIKRAEPGKFTISVYNGQPDPTAGNATASCAPSAALLPDGKRIAVLCKKVEQATTDATGALGFSAAVTGTPQVWTYTYNEHGQMLTGRDPLNNQTTYAYYSDTTDEHTKGDLLSVTNASGQVTRYTRYDRTGRVLQSIDANGAVTDTTYTPRGWVKTMTVTPAGAAAQVTVYDYDGVGQLKKATLSDGTVLEYSYDAAHRLTGVKDGAGNSVTYTLDNTGNRTGEQLKDPSGVLARSMNRVFDALNRVQGTTGGAQ